MLPELSLGPFVGLPTYFIYLSLVYSLMIYLAWRWAQVRDFPLDHVLNLSLVLMIAGMIGGRLFHVFYEGLDYYRSFPSAIFMFWQGGFVFFGGFFAALLAGWIYVIRKTPRIGFLKWADFLAPLGAVGYGVGRVACLLAGCCYGRVCELPWAINGRHPTPLYATIWELSVAALLLVLARQNTRYFSEGTGRLFSLWLLLHSLGRLMMEHFRDDFRGPPLAGLSISSWISLFLWAISLGWLAYSGRPPRPLSDEELIERGRAISKKHRGAMKKLADYDKGK